MMEFRSGPIVRVEYHMDGGFSGRWNADLGHPDFAHLSREPIILTERALDDAVLAANEFKDVRPLLRLKQHRSRRNQAIHDHFAMCAAKLIKQIEDKEGWDEWLSRLREGGE